MTGLGRTPNGDVKKFTVHYLYAELGRPISNGARNATCWIPTANLSLPRAPLHPLKPILVLRVLRGLRLRIGYVEKCRLESQPDAIRTCATKDSVLLAFIGCYSSLILNRLSHSIRHSSLLKVLHYLKTISYKNCFHAQKLNTVYNWKPLLLS